MPATPDERRKTFESLAQKRQEMIDAERAKAGVREREAAERTERERAASIAEYHKLTKRTEQREGWRQEQHTKHEEELELQRKADEEKLRHDELLAKQKEEDAKRVENLHALHDRAVHQKVAKRKLASQHIEEDTVARAQNISDHDLRDVKHTLESTLQHLVQDRRRKAAALESDTERQKKVLTENFAAEKHRLQTSDDPRSGSELLQRTSTYKRALLTLQDRLEEGRMEIEAEYARLKDEANAQAEQKTARLRAEQERRVNDAKRRREAEDKWTDSHRS